jgi:ribokinase
MSAKIVVLGAAVIDHVYTVNKLPDWGEGVHADSFTSLPGGKGLNQAIAAGRLGADVNLVSTVGADYNGHIIIDALEQDNIAHDTVRQIPETLTSIVNVFVNPQSETAFLGWKGAGQIDVYEAILGQAEELIRAADAILLTFEVPYNALERAVKIAGEGKTLVVLNPSPPIEMPRPGFFRLLRDIHLLVPNLTEAENLLQLKAGPKTLASALHEKGAQAVIVTLAEQGCVVAADGEIWEQPSFNVEVVDTTGASDAFCAALAVAVAEGRPLEYAVRRASAAGALAVSQAGASPSMPNIKALEDFLQQQD